MSKILGICDLHHAPKLGRLTEYRPLAATSFLSRYGLIDFTLSNFSNSGIDQIAVLVEENMNAIRGHIRDGNIYINNTKTGFLRLLMNEKQLGTPFNTDVNNLLMNASLMDDVCSDYIVVAPAHYLMSIDYRDIVSEVIKSGADITIVYSAREDANKEFIGADCIELGVNNEVKRIFANPGNKNDRNISLDTYIIKSSIFNGLIANSVHISSLFNLRDMISYAISNHQLFIRGYEFSGYVVPILSLNDYVNHSLELLEFSNRQKLFLDNWPIYTSTHNTPPALYGPEANIKNSFVANGCIIKGKVENSILSRGVTVEKGAAIKNCILFANSSIETNTKMTYVIMDRDAKARQVKKISGKKDQVVVISQGEII